MYIAFDGSNVSLFEHENKPGSTSPLAAPITRNEGPISFQLELL